MTDALKKFDMALVLHLSDHCIWFAKAKVLEELGRMDMAKRAVERAIRLSPGDPEVHLLYGKILYSMNKYPEARDEIEKSLEIQNKSAEALTQAKRAQTRDPKEVSVYLLAIEASRQLPETRREELLAYLDRALTLLHESSEPVLVTASVDGAMSAHYVDDETGMVTINNVYVQ